MVSVLQLNRWADMILFVVHFENEYIDFFVFFVYDDEECSKLIKFVALILQ